LKVPIPPSIKTPIWRVTSVKRDDLEEDYNIRELFGAPLYKYSSSFNY